MIRGEKEYEIGFWFTFLSRLLKIICRYLRDVQIKIDFKLVNENNKEEFILYKNKYCLPQLISLLFTIRSLTNELLLFCIFSSTHWPISINLPDTPPSQQFQTPSGEYKKRSLEELFTVLGVNKKFQSRLIYD